MKFLKGFSLVELLVSLTLLSLMIFIGTFGYQNFSRYWEQEIGDFDKRFNIAKGLNIAVGTLAEVKPYLLLDENKQPYFYFEGGTSVIRSVRANAVSAPGYPAAFEIKVEKIEGLESLRLIYSETPLTAENFQSEANWQEYSYQMVLMENLQDVSFSYYGWPHFTDLAADENSTGTRSREWFGFYSGKDTLLTPDIVKIEMIVAGDEIELKVPQVAVSQDLVNYYLISDS